MASSSKKRKGKSAQNYELAKFKSLFHEDHYNRYTRFREVLPEARIQVDHADFAPMNEQINLRKWQRLTNPIQAIGYSLIREFYANAWIRDEERNQPPSYHTFVRGKDVIFSLEAIHKDKGSSTRLPSSKEGHVWTTPRRGPNMAQQGLMQAH
ncbi:hypothetical protein PIB30_096631 [Stylosanthes scabra]|uniref:Uncharacterized protein n=1 Tax=Stylosanthes scabra TaxID=79078 RepID=A0ABU6VZ74_9FABA|nr:hypothetical protein [Stylosanthes scabra]